MRDRIGTDLDTTLFVEAGAGSGKTTALVDRIGSLVLRKGVELKDVAAVTFTEKAGAELRDRLRTLFERAGEAAALDQLDGAAIGTLHSFAQRLLSEHPIEAGLPPAIEVLDEVGSGVEFERRWSTFRDRLFEDPEMARTLLLLVAAGVKVDALRVLALAFDDNWDLVESRVPVTAEPPPPIAVAVARVVAMVEAVCARRGECHASEDRMLDRLDLLDSWAAAILDATASGDEAGQLEALVAAPSLAVGNVGRSPAWKDLAGVRADVEAIASTCDGAVTEITAACARQIGSVMRRFTLDAAEERRAAGRLQFQDLLVLARSLVAMPAVRRRLHERYRYVLLDEFQDTDPIQIELAVGIAAVTDGGAWDAVDLEPGHLFVVGDPKQSIYRFRRADIATFMRAQRRLAELSRSEAVRLSANFRTVPRVIDWVNRVFGALFGDGEPMSQPEYAPLVAVRPPLPVGPPVVVLGAEPHPKATGADAIRAAEALDVVAAVQTAVAEGWSVGVPAGVGSRGVSDGVGSGGVSDGGRSRPARLGDITILVPSRTSLPFLEDALTAARIPFRAESSSLVYASRAVRDLLMIARAVADPTDHLATLAALRTPLLACGDDDLFRYRHDDGGRIDMLAPVAVSDGPVAAGLTYLRSLHDDRHWLSPSGLLERVASDRRGFELGAVEGRPRDVWRRLRFVIDQARAWSEATGGTLRQYVQWVALQSAEGARTAESVLPETDDDAVRIMTIHAAKGLEFPITILSGMSTRPGGRTASAQVSFPPEGPPGYRFGKRVRTPEYEQWKPIDEQMAQDERIRLLYVACTRARDHLVVSVHRKESAGAQPTNAELLVGAMGDLDVPVIVAPGPSLPDPVPGLPGAATDGPLEEWTAARDAMLAVSARPTTVAATALDEDGRPADEPPDPGLQKRPRDVDLPPWVKGRYGTAVGRAVHGVLQTIDLASGEGLDAAVAAQCEAEAVVEQHADVRLLVQHALSAASVREAARAPHWRELYASTPVGDRLLEGYVDLLYRSEEGLVVVDYKTAARGADLDARMAGYRNQGASYALTVGAAAGEEVARVTFLFLTEDGPVERHMEDLAGAVEDVRRLVAAGAEVVTDQSVTY